MLTKRTNILFDEVLWLKLAIVAKQEQTSVGDLVRKAVIKIYIDGNRQTEKQMAIDKILAIKPIKSKLNYRELFENGRKY